MFAPWVHPRPRRVRRRSRHLGIRSSLPSRRPPMLLHLRVPMALALTTAFLFAGFDARAADTLPHGVAAGDVTQHSAVLWTRSTSFGPVVFEYSSDPGFGHDVHFKFAFVFNPLVPVKVQVGSLKAGTTYSYRVRDASGSKASGHFRTPHELGTHDGLVFGVSGDSRGDLAPYPSVANAVGASLEFFLDLGDTVYVDVESPILPGVDQARTLREFRLKSSEILSERNGLNVLRDLRADTAFFATIDDHEVTNDFAGGAPPSSDDRFDQHGKYINETELYRNGLIAFHEYQPIRNELYGNTHDRRTAFKPKLYRSQSYGSDAAVFILEERSFRDQELVPADPTDPADILRFLIESFDPRRTMLGAAQIADFERDLLQAQQSGITWKFVMVPEPIQNLGVVGASDRYEGYAAERTELLSFITANHISNVVFITADIHGTVVNNVQFQTFVGEPQIETGAFEISIGPIAYAQPFGPTVVELAYQFGLITKEQKDFYDSLPLPGKEEFVRQLVDTQLVLLGYDPIGLDGSPIDATLLEGAYTATHTYGWTDFAVDATSQKLTITTWGLLP